jgi:dCMP deaminase
MHGGGKVSESRPDSWWDNWFLGLAEYVSSASKDPSTKVGSVIVDPRRRIVSLGYNGFPAGIEDTEERLFNRELKYKLVVHAERNALMFSNSKVEGCTIYTWPFMPCSSCASLIIQSGITRVVSLNSQNPRWVEDFNLSTSLFKEASVGLTLYG